MLHIYIYIFFSLVQKKMMINDDKTNSIVLQRPYCSKRCEVIGLLRIFFYKVENFMRKHKIFMKVAHIGTMLKTKTKAAKVAPFGKTLACCLHQDFEIQLISTLLNTYVYLKL